MDLQATNPDGGAQADLDTLTEEEVTQAAELARLGRVCKEANTACILAAGKTRAYPRASRRYQEVYAQLLKLLNEVRQGPRAASIIAAALLMSARKQAQK